MLNSKEVESSSDVLGGELVFRGTRVPVKTLFVHLEAGDTIDDFLDGFPSVSLKQVKAVLEGCREMLMTVS